MAQHDMNIANQGFPATRADLNNALQALVSNSSGTSAPSTTFANQWWYDTTNNKMYLRNEANNAWIEVFVLDQTNNEWQLVTGQISAKDGDGIVFKTDDGNTRVTITDSGSVGIGAAPAGTISLDVTQVSASSNNVLIRARNTTSNEDAGIVVDGNRGGQQEYIMGVNTMAATTDLTLSGPSGYRFYVGSNEEVRIDADGMKFNGDSAAANALDDYEEGTWGANFSVGGGSLTVKPGFDTGLYQKIGDTVFVSIHIRVSALSSPTGGVLITGLPFSTPNNTDYRFSMGTAIHFGMTNMGGDETIIGYITNNAAFINLATQNGDNLTTSVASRFTTSSELYISGHYKV